MAAGASLDFDCTLPFWHFSIVHDVGSLHIKFRQHRSVSDRFITIYVKSRWRPPPPWFLISYFRFWSLLIVHDVNILLVKFHQDRSVLRRVIRISAKSRWRPPLSWILFSHFRFWLFLIVHDVGSLHVKFHQDRPVFGGVNGFLLNQVGGGRYLGFWFHSSGFGFSWLCISRGTYMSNFIKIG